MFSLNENVQDAREYAEGRDVEINQTKAYRRQLRMQRLGWTLIPVSYTHLDVYKRQKLTLLSHKTLQVNYPFLLTVFTEINRPSVLYNSGIHAKKYLSLFECAAVIVRHRNNYSLSLIHI